MAPTTTVEGILLKEGAGLVKSYKKRYFTLVGDELFYYKKQGDSESLGSICLTDTVIQPNTSQENGFVLTGPKLSRAFNLAALTAEEKDKWTAAIESLQAQASGPDEQQAEEVQIGEPQGTPGKKVGLKDFEVGKELGSGQFGKVKHVQLKGTDKCYAMKIMKKEEIVKNGMVDTCKAEKAIMQDITHPYIVKLHFAFQTKEKLYLVMDLLSGGELFSHLSKEGRFPEERCRLYAAEVASALDHVHTENIIYRDLKPENLVLDSEGHVVLTDFGLAKQNLENGGKTYTFCGTPEYVAPEILQALGHDKAVDWWSLGILIYEMLTGLPPFYDENVDTMYKLILEKPLTFPDFVTAPAQDLITQLLNRDPKERLVDGDKIRAHPFFAPIDWGKLLNREMKPSFVPDA